MNRGLKFCGERGWNDVEGELSHIPNRAVFEPLDASELTWEVKREALEYSLFLEQKKEQ